MVEGICDVIGREVDVSRFLIGREVELKEEILLMSANKEESSLMY